MRGQVGNWGGELAVHMDEDMMEWLDAHGTNRHVRLSAMRSGDTRLVFVTPVDKGAHKAFRVTSKPGNGLKRGLSLPHEHVDDFAGLELARCELHEVRFEETSNGHVAAAHVGLDHTLPWPKLRKACDLYASREVMEVELKQRMTSYVRAGRIGQFLRPPQRLINLMAPGAWARIMREVEAECKA